MLTRHLAVEAERTKAGRVAMVDVDPMRGLTQWWESRASETPPLIDIFHGLPAAMSAAKRMKTDILFIDTPPSASPVVEEAIQMADLVLIPVQPSPDDLRAVGSTVDLANRVKKPLVFAITRTKPRVRLTGQAAVVLSQHGTVAPTQISDRTVYAASGTDGRTAPELEPTGEAAREIAELWKYLMKRMTEVLA